MNDVYKTLVAKYGEKKVTAIDDGTIYKVNTSEAIIYVPANLDTENATLLTHTPGWSSNGASADENLVSWAEQQGSSLNDIIVVRKSHSERTNYSGTVLEDFNQMFNTSFKEAGVAFSAGGTSLIADIGRGLYKDSTVTFIDAKPFGHQDGSWGFGNTVSGTNKTYAELAAENNTTIVLVEPAEDWSYGSNNYSGAPGTKTDKNMQALINAHANIILISEVFDQKGDCHGKTDAIAMQNGIFGLLGNSDNNIYGNANFIFETYDYTLNAWRELTDEEIETAFLTGQINTLPEYSTLKKYLSDTFNEQVVCNQPYIQSSVQTIYDTIKNMPDINFPQFSSTVEMPNDEKKLFLSIQSTYVQMMNDLHQDLQKIITYGNNFENLDQELANATPETSTETPSATNYYQKQSKKSSSNNIKEKNDTNIFNSQSNDTTSILSTSSNNSRVVIYHDGENITGLEYYYQFDTQELAEESLAKYQELYSGMTKEITVDNNIIKIVFNENQYQNMNYTEFKSQYTEMEEVS